MIKWFYEQQIGQNRQGSETETLNVGINTEANSSSSFYKYAFLYVKGGMG